MWLVSRPWLLDEVAALHEHAAGAAGGIEDNAVVRLDDVDDGLYQGRRGEEFAVVLRPLHGEFHQEVFIDAAEEIAAGGTYRLGVEGSQDIFQQCVVKLGILLGKLTSERFELLFDGVHRFHQRGAKAGAGGELQQVAIAGFFRQQQGPALDKITLDQRSLGHLAGSLVGLDLHQGLLVAVAGVTEKDDAKHRHAVLAGSQFGVGPKLVGRLPEMGFDLFNIFEGVMWHIFVSKEIE